MNKKSFISLIVLGFISIVFIIISCSPHDVTSSEYVPVSGKTALEYAYECETVLGPLPEFKYEDALEIPMMKDGVPITQGSDNPSDCDNPFAFNAPCDPGNRLGRYQGLNPDGTENSDVVFITFFRGSGLGVIGHKLSTGETCFFEIDDFGDFNSAPIPKPGDANYNDLWSSPAQIAGAFNCVNCHMATPFVHTPAVDQLMNPANTSELLVPITGLNPYSVVGEVQQPYTTNIQNSCTSCHRPACTSHFQNYSLDELVMPAPFENATNFDHSTISNADRQAIRDWCGTLNLSFGGNDNDDDD